MENLAKVIRLLGKNKSNSNTNTKPGPDILGLCEIENVSLANRLIDKIGRDDYRVAEYKDSSDIRGIDTCLIYSADILECKETKSYNVNFRYPTRDIFQANLVLRSNQANLTVLVNHWPSRKAYTFIV